MFSISRIFPIQYNVMKNCFLFARTRTRVRLFLSFIPSLFLYCCRTLSYQISTHILFGSTWNLQSEHDQSHFVVWEPCRLILNYHNTIGCDPKWTAMDAWKIKINKKIWIQSYLIQIVENTNDLFLKLLIMSEKEDTMGQTIVW